MPDSAAAHRQRLKWLQWADEVAGWSAQTGSPAAQRALEQALDQLGHALVDLADGHDSRGPAAYESAECDIAVPADRAECSALAAMLARLGRELRQQQLGEPVTDLVVNTARGTALIADALQGHVQEVAATGEVPAHTARQTRRTLRQARQHLLMAERER